MNLFKIHRHERIPSLLAAAFIVLLNTLNVLKYFDIFSRVQDNYHALFWGNYHISGYDPFTYETVSRWDVLYETTRHPLMAFYMYIPAKINEELIALTGMNCATVIVAVIWSLCAFYSFLFLFRILHELEGISMRSSCLLCALFYSFGYTMLSTFVPDHFGPSTMLLLLTIYLVGLKSVEKKDVGLGQSVWLFVLTAGVTLSNGVKVFLAAWINKGRRFFRPKYIICGVIMPSLLLFGFAQLEQQVFVQPRLAAAQQKKMAADRAWRMEVYKTYCDTTNSKDSAAIKSAVGKILHDRIRQRYKANHSHQWSRHKVLSKQGFLSWTDVSTPRMESLKENVFGEPVQMHDEYFLGDVFGNRPVRVVYGHWYNYLAEVVLLILMIMGIVAGRNRKPVWTALSFFAFDMLIHLGLGFGLNEVYIMSPHYLFIIPVVIAPLFATGKEAVTRVTAGMVGVLTLWFAYWNLSLLIPFLS